MSPHDFSDLAPGDRLHLPATVQARISVGAVQVRVEEHVITVTPDMLVPEQVSFGTEVWDVVCRAGSKIGICRKAPPGGTDVYVFVDTVSVHSLV